MRIGRTAAVTDTGRRRIHNEDALVCSPPLFAVADGMGGAQAGELASALAVETLGTLEQGRTGEAALASLVQAANERIWKRSLADIAAAGMGTTVTAALVDEPAATVAVAHVGDSRAYLIRGGGITQLTADHSLVAELVRSGRLTQEEADAHPQRAVITRALGTEPEIEVDTFTVAGEHGDLFLVCSDGLTTMVSDTDVLALAEATAREPQALAEALRKAANAAGGEDNVTVVLFELVEGDDDVDGRAGAAHVPADDTREDAPQQMVVATGTVAAQSSPAHAAPPPVSTHGAGPGSRAWAIGLILTALVVAALLFYVGLR